MSTPYFGNVNTELLRWVPLDAARVLEVGCGEGALAAAYKLRNPRAHYTAVEVHGPSAAVARDRVDRLIEGAFEATIEQDLAAEGLFDVVVMGDVLEHLADPWSALAQVRRLLRPGGWYVCSVPNVAHWSVLAEVMSGRWPARDSGIFDRTHLRFFTLESLQQMLRQAGFTPAKIRARNVLLDRAEAERWTAALADAADKLGLDAEHFRRRAEALQYVVCAAAPRAGEALKPPAQLCVAAMAPRFLEVRTRLPAEQLESLPDLLVTYGEKNVALPPPPAPGAPRILVLQRFAAASDEAWLQQLSGLIRKGWLVIAEQDDHPALYVEAGLREEVRFDFVLGASHAVQTSTPALVEAFRPHNSEVALFPNALFELGPYRDRRAEPPKVFYGALNRERFSARIADALGPCLEAHPEAEFVVVHDRAFFERLGTERKTFLPALPYEKYTAAMAACHVALMPLEGTFGESFKSDIKFLEASSLGLATVASPAVYGDTIVHGKTGLIAREPQDWPVELGRLLGDPEMRTGLARRAWEYVRSERMFAYQAAARRDWYRSLWERREELTAGLVQRNPRLAELVRGAS